MLWYFLLITMATEITAYTINSIIMSSFQKQLWQEGCAHVSVTYQHLSEKNRRSIKLTKVTWELIILHDFHKTSLYHRSQGYKTKHVANTTLVDFNLLH